MLPEMDDQKDFWIFGPKADRNDGSAFFRGAAFAVVTEPAYLLPRCVAGVAGAVRAR